MKIKLHIDNREPLIFDKEDKLYPIFIKEPKTFIYKDKQFYLEKSLINLESFYGEDKNYIELYYKERII